jgi:hypothetical protein
VFEMPFSRNRKTLTFRSWGMGSRSQMSKRAPRE